AKTRPGQRLLSNRGRSQARGPNEVAFCASNNGEVIELQGDPRHVLRLDEQVKSIQKILLGILDVVGLDRNQPQRVCRPSEHEAVVQLAENGLRLQERRSGRRVVLAEIGNVAEAPERPADPALVV